MTPTQPSPSPQRPARSQPHASGPPARLPLGQPGGPRNVPSLRLAAMARQGSAAALRLLSARCQAGALEERLAALRLLPGLLPFQPVLPILAEVDEGEAPAAIRKEVQKVRCLLDDPRDCEPVYRAVQRILCGGFAESERQALCRGPRTPRSVAARRDALRLSVQVVTALYNYRFELADGCLGDLGDQHIEEFLLEYAPRRLLVSPQKREQVPRVLMRHITWLRLIGHLLPRRAHRLCILCLRLLPRYLEASAPPAQPGSPRAAVRRATVDGIDLMDSFALGRYLTLHGLDLHDEFAPVFCEA